MAERERGTPLFKTACISPTCTSSDGLQIYQHENDIRGHCFVCNQNFYNLDPDILEPIAMEYSTTKPKKDINWVLENSTEMAIEDRGLPLELVKEFKVRVGINPTTGEIDKHYYPAYKEGVITGYKVRDVATKEFYSIGDCRDVEMFGQHRCGNNGKLLIVTEGELDAMAATQMIRTRGKNYRVVSLPSGASDRAVKVNLAWLESFNTICLSLDQDGPGKEAAKAIAEVVKPGKCKVMTYSEKDPCDMLLKGKQAEYFGSIYNAQDYRPDGIVSVEDVFEEAIKPVQWGLSWPWPTLTAATYGYRRREIYGFGAGSGCVDNLTEFLTPSGWKRISDYVEGDLVAQFNGGSISFVEPEKYIKKPADEMYHIKTKYGIDMVLSDDHRVLSYTVDGVENINPLSEIRHIHNTQATGFRGRILCSFSNTAESSIDIKNEYLRLKVAVFADGSFSKKGNANRCRVRVKKVAKKERLEMLLRANSIDYTRGESGEYSIFSFIMDNNDKVYPTSWYGLDEAQRSIIAEECLLWDGDGERFFTSEKQSADFIQYVFTTCGYRSSIHTCDRVGQMRGKYMRKSKEYSVTRVANKFCSFRKTQSSQPKFESFSPEDGMQYCFTVPSGLFVIRRDDRIAVTGNCGKTEGFKEIINHVIYDHQLPVGVIFLEEEVSKTLKVLAGKRVNKRFHVPDGDWTIDELSDGINDLRGRVYLYNHFGGKDWESIKKYIRHMVHVIGIKDIFLDHLTALVAQEPDEYRALNKIMEEMASLVQELDCTIFYISHLRKASGTPHEEGGHVSADQFKGSGAIVFWSNFLFGYERNQLADDVDDRNTTIFRVLKDRNTGLSTGVKFQLGYDHTTGRWIEKRTETEEEEMLL